MTQNKSISGAGVISGSGVLTGVSGGGGFAHVYQFPPTTDAVFMLDFNTLTAVFYEDPAEILMLQPGKVVTVSGVTGPNSSVNGTTFTVSETYPYPSYNYIISLPDDTFPVECLNLGMPFWGFEPLQQMPGLTWSWN